MVKLSSISILPLVLPSLLCATAASSPDSSKIVNSSIRKNSKIATGFKRVGDETARIIASQQSRRSLEHRNLQAAPGPFVPTRECNARFGTITSSQLTSISETLLGLLFPPGSGSETVSSSARAFLVDSIQYDLAVFKVCGSCGDFSGPSISDYVPYRYPEYCPGQQCSDRAVHYDLSAEPGWLR